MAETAEDSAEAPPTAYERGVYRLDLASGSVAARRQTPQGGMICDANLTRTGVFTYRQADGSTRRELRHPDEVFHPDSLKTYPVAPVTVDHPGRVGPDNWRTHAVGTVGPTVRRNGDFVTGELHIQHGSTIQRADSGDLREVSCGYQCDVDHVPGTYQGQPYDASQRNIRINHVAIGPRGWGRMGPETKMHLDAASAVSVEDRDSYVRAQEVMTMADNAALEKATGDLKKAEADLAQARQDAVTAKSEGERLNAKQREDAAEIAQLKAQRQLDQARISQLETEHHSPAARQKADSQRQADLEELITVREDARHVFQTAADPDAKNWKADGKGADQIRREILGIVAPDLKLDGIDAITDARTRVDALKGIYATAMTHKRAVDKSRADALAAVTGQRLDGKEGDDDGDEDDDEKEPSAEKARKDMVKRKKDSWKMSRKDRMRLNASAAKC